MSAPALPAQPGTATVAKPPRVSQAGVIRSEWTKLHSVRSTAWTLLVAVVLTVGMGAIITAVEGRHFHSLSAAGRATFDPISSSLGGLDLAELAIGVLGVLVVAAEYSTGMIRSSMTVVPRRLPVLWGKVVVLAAVSFAAMIVATLAAFLLGQRLLGSHGVGLSADGAARSVVGSALAVTVIGVIGLALGALLRNTAAGISAFVALFFVIPPLASLLPGSWTSAVTPYLPDHAFRAVFSGPTASDVLAPWAGFGVLCAYAAVLLAGAAWRLRSSDV